MNLERISYSESRTIAGKRFESIRPTVSADMSLTPGEDVGVAMKTLKGFVKKHLAMEVQIIQQDLNPAPAKK